MHKQAKIYVAVDPQDQPIADILEAYLKSPEFRFVNYEDVESMMTPAIDLYNTMNDCDVLLLIDSQAFRAQPENLELAFAQELSKPLIVISLHQAVNERKSTHRVRLFDFTQPHHRNWSCVVKTIAEMIRATRIEPEFTLLY